MSMTDPIADLLTRIRNANMRQKPTLSMPSSKMKLSIARVLKDEGFIEDYSEEEATPAKQLHITLRYYRGTPVIRRLIRVSKPGLRQYQKANEMKPVVDGQGIAIVSTSQGILTDRQCREQKVGGEVLCKVW
ncbi:MAG: 30S ribosomal protein S8 [bacterium]|jgi:small subunit ribosomal protein S8